MPFVSKAQQRYMFLKNPTVAKEWAAKTPNMKGLPEHVKGSKAKKTPARRKK